MSADIYDVFDTAPVEMQTNPRIAGLVALPTIQPCDVTERFDIFGNHRDWSSRNILGLNFSWSTPAAMLYDWYQSETGMTVSLESFSTINRVRPCLITVRVRHYDPTFDRSIMKTGKTWSIHPDAADAQRARHAIRDAIECGASPLWRLKTKIGLPDWIETALLEPMHEGEVFGHLDKKTTGNALMTGFITEEEILGKLGARKSPYLSRRR